jgi:hypothetical protein
MQAFEEISDNVSMSEGSAREASKCTSVPSSTLPSNYQSMKKEIRHISDPQKMRSYILEHDAELSAYSTAILNSWLNIEGYRFYRKHQILGLTKQSEPRYRCVSKLCEEVDAFKDNLQELRQLIAFVYQYLKIPM